MSFAIFKTGGKQYKVQASEILKIEKLEKPEGENIEFNEILAYGNKENIELGSPIIKGAKIEAELLSNSKERTVLVFKKRRRKNSRRKYGHRQPISLIRITKIFSKDGKIVAEAGPQKKITKEIIKGNKEREKQIKDTNKLKVEKTQEVKKMTQKLETKVKKNPDKTKKTELKKSPLTTKKK